MRVQWSSSKFLNPVLVAIRDFSTCSRQTVQICKISVKTPYDETLSIYYQTHFGINFSNTFDTFKVLYIFHIIIMGKLDLRQTPIARWRKQAFRIGLPPSKNFPRRKSSTPASSCPTATDRTFAASSCGRSSDSLAACQRHMGQGNLRRKVITQVLSFHNDFMGII